MGILDAPSTPLPRVTKPALTYSRATETAADTQIRALLVSLGFATDSTVA